MQIVIAALAGSELMALVFFYAFDGVVHWYMYFGLLLGGLVFPKLGDLIEYVFSGKPLTIEALWQHFLEKAAMEYNPILLQILQWLKDNWESIDIDELQEFLKKSKVAVIQDKLHALQAELQELKVGTK